MKTFIYLILAMVVSSNVFATTEVRCQKEVEKQERSLAMESRAMLVNKITLMKQIERGSFDQISHRTALFLLRLLSNKSAMPFTFTNDAGVWLTIADYTTCKVHYTKQIVAY